MLLLGLLIPIAISHFNNPDNAEFCTVNPENYEQDWCSLVRDVEGNHCWPCPKNGICSEGRFTGCKNDYTMTGSACVPSTSKVEQNLVNYLYTLDDSF